MMFSKCESLVFVIGERDLPHKNIKYTSVTSIRVTTMWCKADADDAAAAANDIRFGSHFKCSCLDTNIGRLQ